MPDHKLAGYLLNDSHPEGRHKAVFFQRFGFRRDAPEGLRTALLDVARRADMSAIVFAFGTKYVGESEVVSPSGEPCWVRTVWVMRDNTPPPLFVTAYPAERSRS